MLATTALFERAFFVALQHHSLWHRSVDAFFGLAGIATTGRPLPRETVRAVCCTAPFGGSYCGGAFCQGPSCGTPTFPCQFVSGYCPSGSACWVMGLDPCFYNCTPDCSCCDCICYEPSTGAPFYCYCTNC
jgi:hypothetical protein